MTPQTILSFLVLVILFGLERRLPARKPASPWWRHLRRNGVLGGLNSLLTNGLGTGGLVAATLWSQSHQVGILRVIPLNDGLRLTLAFFIFDGWTYAWHRMNHRVPFLWRFHRVHHTDPAMDMSTVLRFHPVEILISSVLNIGVMTLIGMDLEHLLVYKTVFRLNVFLHHSNINIPEKWDRCWRTVLVSPNMHRVHHSTQPPETDSNYASVFSFWDRLFGTYRQKDPSKITFGLNRWMEDQWQTVKGLLLLPFQQTP